MARTAFNAPGHRILQRNAPGNAQQGPNAAPSIDYGGQGLQDPRWPWNTFNSTAGAQVIGWLGAEQYSVCNQVPSAISTSNIAAAQAVTNGTPMTLVATTGAGISVLASSMLAIPAYASNGGVLVPAGTLAIDGVPNYIRFGLTDFTAFYDPTAGISRGISITAASGAAGGNILVSGYDWYGFPMSQLITTVAGSTVNSLKTLKFITQAVPQFTDAGHNYSIGTADIYGFNLASDYFAEVNIFWNNTLQTASTYLPAVTTAATSGTGDVRGTFTPASSSNGTIRLQIYVTPSLARIATSPMSQGLFGVPQA